MAKKTKTIVADPELVAEHEKEWVDANKIAEIRPLYDTKQVKLTAEEEYKRLYGWIGKGNIDDTLKGILKELVTIRMGGGHV